MRHTVTEEGERPAGKAFDDKTKYARMLAIPAAIVLVLLDGHFSYGQKTGTR